jgi:putative ABC transport system substrate-binding protein
MEALKETFPHLTRVAGLFNSTNLGDEPQAQFKQMEIAAKSMKIELHQFLVQGTGDFNNTFSAMAKRRIEGVVINEDPLLIGNAKAIAEIAAQHRIPLAGFIEIADAGGLIAYGVNNVELWRRAGSFVDRILKGANPGEMPIEQATKFEFVLNMKTAKALGIKIPQSILVRADRVIE